MTTKQVNWAHKDIWTRRGDGFSVQVSRHTEEPYDRSEGDNRWCVYAYIYPTHPHFKNFEGDMMWQPAACELPLHGGPSLLRWHIDKDGKIGSVQVGADYHHIQDKPATFWTTKEDAWVVFNDASNLFDWLSEKK